MDRDEWNLRVGRRRMIIIINKAVVRVLAGTRVLKDTDIGAAECHVTESNQTRADWFGIVICALN